VADAVLDALARPATLCAFCPKMCRSACPVAETEGREATTPWAKMSLVHLARNGQASLADPSVVKTIEACTGCGACVEQCAHGNPVAETLFSARGASSSPRAAEMRAQFERTGDVRGRDLHARLTTLRRDAHAKVAYFPGCTRLARDDEGAMSRDLRALEQALGSEVAACDLAEGAACCGYPLYADGQHDLVEQNLRRIGEALQHHEIVVTPDPGCAYMLSTVRDALLGGGRGKQRPWPKVLPIVEVLGDRAERFAGKAKGVRAKYHDPCYLARRGRTFDAPRRLIAAATGQPVVEFAQHREQADCSGSGGLYPTSNPDMAKEAARRRVERDAAQAPYDVLVTACPSARRGFERAGIRCVDVVDLVLGET
jgi:Fe-S oxidoreductase